MADKERKEIEMDNMMNETLKALNLEELEKAAGGKKTKKKRAAERMRRNNERSEMLALEKQRREEAKLADFEM